KWAGLAQEIQNRLRVPVAARLVLVVRQPDDLQELDTSVGSADRPELRVGRERDGTDGGVGADADRAVQVQNVSAAERVAGPADVFSEVHQEVDRPVRWLLLAPAQESER